MWRHLKTKLNNFNFSKYKDSEKKDEPCPYEEFVKEQEEVLKDNADAMLNDSFSLIETIDVISENSFDEIYESLEFVVEND